MGIGTPIAERPSHTTGLTDHVSGDSAGHRSGIRRGESSVVFTARFSCGYRALC